LHIFFNEFVKHIVERKLSTDRVFNMDETGFAQKSKCKKVIAVHGSKNVWSKSVEASFHLTLVACVGASGFVVPPMFIVPGKRLNRDVLDSCPIAGSVVSVSPRGFMNSNLFIQWLVHFENNVPGDVKRPIVLVYDGYGSHYNEDIILKAIQIKVILILLPANATHLIQPLDIAVFKPFKTVLKQRMEAFMIENASTSYSKKDAIEISSAAWTEGIINKAENIVSGFKASGIWPPSFVMMQKHWRLYHNGGVNSQKVEVESWLKTREDFRNEMLLFPAHIDRTKKRRKTLDANNRLLMQEQFNLYDE